MNYLIGLVVEPVEKELNLRDLEGSALGAGGVFLGYGIDFNCPYWSYKVKALRLLNDETLEIIDSEYDNFTYSEEERESLDTKLNAVLADFIYNTDEMYVKVFDQRGLKHTFDNVCALVNLDNNFLGHILCSIPLIGCDNYIKCGDKRVDNYILDDNKELMYGYLISDKDLLIKGKECRVLSESESVDNLLSETKYESLNMGYINDDLVDKSGTFGLR